MNHRSFVLFVFLMIATGTALFSQPQSSFLVKKVTPKGLPPETGFNCMQQDDDGFMWLGSLSGLYRYDGLRLIRFLRDPGDSNSLSHNYANSLSKDQNGNIWIGTFGGFMNVYERLSGKIRRVEPGVLSELRPVVFKTKATSGGYVMTATAQCFYKINLAGTVVDSIVMPISPHDKSKIDITDFKEYETDKFIVSSTSGLFTLDWRNRNMTLLPVSLNEKASFSCIERDNDDNFWIGMDQGILILKPDFRLNDQRTSGIRLQLNKTVVNTIKKDGSGRMWIGTNNGLFISGPGMFQKINGSTADSMRGINEIFIDNKGMAWVSASGNSLYQVYQPGIIFRTIPGIQAFSKNKKIQSILEEKPGIWLIGTMFGLYRYSFSTDKFEEVALSENGKKPWIGCQLLDRNNGYWVGTFGDGVFYRPPGNTRFIQFMNDPQTNGSFPFTTIVALAEDSHGNIWMGSFSNGTKSNSLCYYDPRSKRIELISGTDSDPAAFSAVDISQIEADRNKHLWIGTWDKGLYRYDETDLDPRQNKFISYSESSRGAHRISHNIVSSARPGTDGKVWFGTISGGINRLDTKTDSVRWFTTGQGLSSNLIYRIEEDDHGIIWMSTDNGISRLDPTTKSFINYNTSSGLPVNNFTFLTSVKCKDGTIAFGTDDGQVIYFNPNSYKNLVNAQPVVLTDIKLFNKSLGTGSASLLKKAPYLTDTLRLNYDHSVVSFELANMDFLNPEIFTYAYKLEGFDRDWAYITDRNSITYTNLDPGKYTLLIKNANHLGIWNEVPTSVFIVIKPPFWRTWWFLSLVLVVVAGLIYGLFQYRLRQKLRILGVRNRLHRDLHDDVGATLSSVKAYSTILKDNPDNPVIAQLIHDNSTEMIERLEVIAWATNPQHDHFQSLKNRMTKFAAALCHANNIQWSIESDGIDDETMMPGEIRQNIFLVFKEAVNNMIKYAEATNCETKMAIRHHHFTLKITDNGKGTDGTVKGTGDGWKNMQKRVASLDGRLTIDSSPDKGTRVDVNLPYPFKIPNSWERNRI